MRVKNRGKLVGPTARFYEFRNKTANSGEITLYGPIGEDFWGDGISAASFRTSLKSLGNVRTIDLHVDSPGGSVTDARNIYTQLVEHPATVNVKIDGQAASAASFIAMAGDSIDIAEGGLFMIHNARGVARGTADDMDRAAMLLRSVDTSIVQTYVARTGQTDKQVRDWMSAETWFVGQEAVDAGFATGLMANKRVEAFACPPGGDRESPYKNVPQALRPAAMRARNLRNRMERLLDEAA